MSASPSFCAFEAAPSSKSSALDAPAFASTTSAVAELKENPGAVGDAGGSHGRDDRRCWIGHVVSWCVALKVLTTAWTISILLFYRSNAAAPGAGASYRASHALRLIRSL